MRSAISIIKRQFSVLPKRHLDVNRNRFDMHPYQAKTTAAATPAIITTTTSHD